MKMTSLLLFSLISVSVFAADPALISTNGSAEKSMEPNMVIVSIESFGKAGTAKIAQEKQALEFKRIKLVADKYKIKGDDLQTENLSLNQEYSYDQKTQTNKVTGYRVSHQIRLVVKQKDSIGSIIDELSSSNKPDSSGVQIQNIRWDNDNKQSLNGSLINEAVAEAKKKAELLASAAGVKIKGIQSIQFSAPQVNYPMRENMMMAKSLAADSGTEVSAGSVKVKVDVSMQFKID